MDLNLNKPLAFFDLETTGINIATDRIVEISILKVQPNGEEEVTTMKINPTIPIPAESSEVHGIYDEDVKDAPTFQEVAKDLAKIFQGCDLGGYNLLKFDIPLLTEEFLRAEVDFSIDSARIVDAQRIFYLMEPRTLTAAYKFYCDKELDGAHSAEADTKASFEVFKAQIAHYEGTKIKDRNGNLIEPIQNDIQAIHDLNANRFADLVGRLAYNSNKEVVFNFGKHKNKLVTDVFRQEPSYYDWIMRGDFPLSTKKKLTEIKLKMSLS